MLALLLTTMASGVTVTLPVEAKVRGTEIELGEVAQVAGLDAELIERVRALELGYAPAPGFSRLLTLERIRAALSRDLPGVEVRVAGERACRVWPVTETIDATALEAAARLELARVLAGKDATFTLKDPLAAVQVPLGERGHELLARGPAPDALVNDIVGVPVEVLVDGLRYRTVWTSWRVDVWETRPVLSRPVKAGEPLRAEHFERSRVRLGSDTRLEPLGPVQLAGAVAKHDLAPGEPVTQMDVHRPPAVTLGATLFLRVRKGSIEARVAALALETGAVGDRIRVRTNDSAQELLATVVGRDLCEIQL